MGSQASRKSMDWTKILSPVVIILIAVLFTSVLMGIVGGNPLEAYYCMLVGAFGSGSAVINTINKMVPIAFAGFAVALSSKAGVFNIGIEGQLVFGALGSALAGIYLTGLPAVLHIPLSILSGMVFGMVYAVIPSALYVKKGTSLLVLHIMMNNIASLLITYFVMGVFPGENRMIAATDPIQPTAELPYLITSPNKLTIGILIAILAGIVLWLYINKTTAGFEFRACGGNAQAALFSGIRVKRYQFLALLSSGALAGLAGSIEVLGTYHRLYDGFSPGYGFDGIPIAMLAGGNPVGVMIGAFLFGALRVGSLNMQLRAGIPTEIISVIQGIMITLIAASYIIRFAISKAAKRQRGERP